MVNTPSLLNKERCLVFNPTLARLIGDRQAILLQQIQYWLDINEQTKNEYNYREGRWWTYNTYEAWVEESFPFWSTRMLRRLMKDLEEKGLVITKKFECSDWKQRKWYTIDYDAVESLKNAESTEKSDVAKSVTSNQPNGADHLYTETSSETTQPRTAFFSKTAECGEALLNSGQGEPDGNCPTPPPNGRSPKKPSKPKKLFDGSSELSVDHNGWVALPKAIDVAPRYRELIGPVVAQTMVWAKVWFVGHYSGELELTLHYQDDGVIYAISGKDFDVMAYSEFLSKDGPVPLRVMRGVVMDRTGGFQEEFNDVLSYYFWEAWGIYCAEECLAKH